MISLYVRFRKTTNNKKTVVIQADKIVETARNAITILVYHTEVCSTCKVLRQITFIKISKQL